MYNDFFIGRVASSGSFCKLHLIKINFSRYATFSTWSDFRLILYIYIGEIHRSRTAYRATPYNAFISPWRLVNHPRMVACLIILPLGEEFRKGIREAHMQSVCFNILQNTPRVNVNCNYSKCPNLLRRKSNLEKAGTWEKPFWKTIVLSLLQEAVYIYCFPVNLECL